MNTDHHVSEQLIAEQYRARAHLARCTAEEMTRETMRRQLLRLAEEYEVLADRLEQECGSASLRGSKRTVRL
jgi:hypothetical protein